MTAALVLTAAGAAAIADGANIGTRAVTFTRLALGDGTGMGDRSGQMALESQQDIVAVAGSTAVPGRIPIRGDFMPTQTYAATEIGLFARIGDDGAEFLAAYWIAEDAAGAFAGAAAGTALVVAGIVEIVANAADINIAPAVNISVGVPPDVIRESDHATVDQRGIVRLATAILARAGRNADRAITPATLAAVLADYGTRAWVQGLIDNLVGGAPGALDTLNELAEALNDNENAYDTLLGLINARITQAAADVRYPLRADVPVVLNSSDPVADIAANRNGDIPLAADLRNFRTLYIGINTFPGGSNRWVSTLQSFPVSYIPRDATSSGPHVSIGVVNRFLFLLNEGRTLRVSSGSGGRVVISDLRAS